MFILHFFIGCKSLDTVRRGRTPGHLLLPFGQFTLPHPTIWRYMTIIPDKNAKIGVVSNDFHLFRAGMLVRAKGFHNVSTIAARSDEVLFLNYRVREYFGVLKDLFGVKFFHFIGE